jgi:hypothetical protein
MPLAAALAVSGRQTFFFPLVRTRSPLAVAALGLPLPMARLVRLRVSDQSLVSPVAVAAAAARVLRITRKSLAVTVQVAAGVLPQLAVALPLILSSATMEGQAVFRPVVVVAVLVRLVVLP